MSQPSEFTTPPGRIVWGHPARASVKKHQSGELKGKPVLKDGKQVEQYVCGIAYNKAEFNQHVLPWLQYEAAKGYPSGVPQGFSWKYKDGDGVDRGGKPYAEREGWKGCYVLTVSTEAFAPQIFKNEGGRYRQLEANEIKTGDFVVVGLNVKVNVPTDRQHTPGLYVNPKGFELIGYGQEIISQGADPDEMFGGRTYQLPPGATAAPQAPAGGATPPYAAAPQGYPPQPPAAAPQGYPPQPPAAAPQGYPPHGQQFQAHHAPATPQYPAPAYDLVQNAGQPPAAAPQGYPPQPQQGYGYPPGVPPQGR